MSDSRREWAQPNLHIAVFHEPYRTLVLQGRKTIESRFARTRHPPYQVVRAGDVILIKDVGGPISGIVLAGRVESMAVCHRDMEAIQSTYQEQLCISDPHFWDAKRNSSFVTLIHLYHAAALGPIDCDKRDRRGWVTIGSNQLTLGL